MIQHRAVEGSSHGGQFFIANQDDPALVQLREACFANDEGDRLVATKKAMSEVQLTQCFVGPTVILEYKSDPPPTEGNLTTIDVLLALQARGWTKEGKNSKIKHDPYHPGSPKLILYRNRSALSKMYLLALLKSEQLFEKGVLCIHYWQPVAYYKALVQLESIGSREVVNVQPNKTLADYKRLTTKLGPLPHAIPRNMDSDEEGANSV